MIRSLLEARTRFYVLAAAVAPLALVAGCNTSHGDSAAAEQSALYVDTAAFRARCDEAAAALAQAVSAEGAGDLSRVITAGESRTLRIGDRTAKIDETMGATRHIVSTTLTTVGGFVPLLLFTGGDFWPPLAIVIAGGVALSISLSLVLTPTVYSRLGAVRIRTADSAWPAISPGTAVS